MPDLSDAITTLQEVKDLIGRFSAERDWDQFHSLKNLAMAISSEAGELMAHFRWSAESVRTISDPAALAEIRHEVADVLLLLAEFARVAEIDMAAAVAEKMELNTRRYPVEKARGTAAKYDRL